MSVTIDSVHLVSPVDRAFQVAYTDRPSRELGFSFSDTPHGLAISRNGVTVLEPWHRVLRVYYAEDKPVAAPSAPQEAPKRPVKRAPR